MPRFFLGKADLQPWQARVVSLHDMSAPWRSILVARTEAQFVAYWNVCRHLPIPLDAGSGDLGSLAKEWVCQTHGARFRVVDGSCVFGPCAGQSLLALRVHHENGQLWAEGKIPDEVV